MPIGITRSLTTWQFQDHYVERLMDNAAYSSAHPDDTLVLAGPARESDSSPGATEGVQSLLAIGMLQTISFQQAKPTQAQMAIGSGRSFFVSGKAQGSGSIQRLFVNGRNLLRVLHHNARATELPVQNFDDPAARSLTSQFYINLDSELYLIPFGLASIFRTKAHHFVGGFYAELTLINSYAIGFQAGGVSISEQVNFSYDRLLPYAEDSIADGPVDIATMDKVLAFTDNTTADAQAENLTSATVASNI